MFVASASHHHKHADTPSFRLEPRPGALLSSLAASSSNSNSNSNNNNNNNNNIINNRSNSAAAAAVAVAASSSSPMERSAAEYSQSGLPSPYPSNFGDTQSEGSSADHPTVPPYPPPVKDVLYQGQPTPTSEYSVNHPSSARSAFFPPDQLHRSYANPTSANSSSTSSGGMAQQDGTGPPPHSLQPLQPLQSLQQQQDGQDYHAAQQQHLKSDPELPIDPSITASSPTFPQYPTSYSHVHHPQNPYQPTFGNRQPWFENPSHSMSATPAPYIGQAAAAPRPQIPTGQVYSFVPIPGAQQHKRPRRRYEEIERMYKCGWNGCEKAYGTLNHLNAHVTMQSHGQKRTPEEFKEIRKEWKARKKQQEDGHKTGVSKATADADAEVVAASRPMHNDPETGDPQSAGDERQQPLHSSRPLPPIATMPAMSYSQYPAPPPATLTQSSGEHTTTSSGYPYDHGTPYTSYTGQFVSPSGAEPPNQ